MLAAPLLRAQFIRGRQGRWQLRRIHAIPLSEVPDEHRSFLMEAIRDFCSSPARAVHALRPAAFSLAMLVNPDDPLPPSNRKALDNFIRAGARLDMSVQPVTRDEFAHLPEYDALFIRDTTQVNNHTYRFARRAELEGMPVIDDPMSILRCTNKVYLAELMAHHRIRTPKTRDCTCGKRPFRLQDAGVPLHPQTAGQLLLPWRRQGGYPRRVCGRLCGNARQVRTDHRPGVPPHRIRLARGCTGGQAALCLQILHGRTPLADIQQKAKSEDGKWGMTETLRVEDAPAAVLKTAVDAARLIGNGLYGVDLKEINGIPHLIEINDNPSLDAGIEDEVLGMELYTAILKEFRQPYRQSAEQKQCLIRTRPPFPCFRATG